MDFSKLKHKLFTRANKSFTPVINDSRKASYFTITLSLFCVSFFGLFAIRPTLITAVKLIKEVSDLKKLNLQYENKISNIIKAQSEYEKIRDSLYLVDEALPFNAQFPKLARGLESFSTNSNIRLNQLQIDAAPISQLPSAKKLQNYGFILIGVGDYPAVSSLLTRLINWQRIINIKSLDLYHEGGSISANLRISMKADSYYEP